MAEPKPVCWVCDGMDPECPKCRERSSVEAGRVEVREQLAAWMIDHGFATGHGSTVSDLLKELAWQVEELKRQKAD